MKLQQFDGGLSTRLRPQYIGITEGAVYTNIDNSKGSLVPVQGKVEEPSITVGNFNFYYEAKDQWVSSSNEATWVEYKNVLYKADGNQATKFDGINEYNLGIDAPNTAVTTTAEVVPQTPSGVNVNVIKDVPGLIVRTEAYLLVNSDDDFFANPLYFTVNSEGETSEPEEFSRVSTNGLFPAARTTTSTDTRTITISNVTGADYGASGIKVYRAYAGYYRLIGTLTSSASSIVDSTDDISALPLLDATKFAKLEGTYQYRLTYLNNGDGAESGPNSYSSELTVKGFINVSDIPVSSDPQVDKKKLYRIGGNSTIPTLVTTLDNATTTFYDNVLDVDLLADVLETDLANPAPEGLKYLKEAYAMLWGAVDSKLYYTPIDQPNSWPELYYIDYADTITGIAPVANGVMVMTKYKCYLVTGTGPTTLASQLLRSDQGCIANSSIQVFQGAAIWASTDGLCVSAGGAVTLLTKDKLGKLQLNPVSSCIYDEVYYLVENNGDMLVVDMRYTTVFKTLKLGVSHVIVANDVLYGWQDSVMYKLFASDAPETFEFLSARFTESMVSYVKSYKKFHLYSKGDIIIEVLGEDNSVLARKTFTTTDTHEFQIPSGMQRQEFIQLRVSGTGEVFEIRFEAERG